MPQNNTPRSKTPRPQCEGCNAWRNGPGCGYLDARKPCGHSVERHRFDAAGRDITGLYGLYDDDTDHEVVTVSGGPQLRLI
jgi:hypothetical protein